MAEKAPFKLSIALEGFRPEAINAALDRLNDLCSEHDQSGKVSAKVVIEGYQEDALVGIREQIETYLRVNKFVLEGKVTMESPVVRPQPEKTPMERMMEALQPGPGESAIEMSAGGRTVRLEPKTA